MLLITAGNKVLLLLSATKEKWYGKSFLICFLLNPVLAWLQFKLSWLNWSYGAIYSHFQMIPKPLYSYDVMKPFG